MVLLIVAQWTALALTPFAIIAFYIYWNDKALKRIPASALYFSPKRCTVQDVHAMAESLANSPPVSIKDQENTPLKTGRRYIVVGGVRLIYMYCVRFSIYFCREVFSAAGSRQSCWSGEKILIMSAY
jgi:hypothetical protein